MPSTDGLSLEGGREFPAAAPANATVIGANVYVDGIFLGPAASGLGGVNNYNYRGYMPGVRRGNTISGAIEDMEGDGVMTAWTIIGGVAYHPPQPAGYFPDLPYITIGGYVSGVSVAAREISPNGQYLVSGVTYSSNKADLATPTSVLYTSWEGWSEVENSQERMLSLYWGGPIGANSFQMKDDVSFIRVNDYGQILATAPKWIGAIEPMGNGDFRPDFNRGHYEYNSLFLLSPNGAPEPVPEPASLFTALAVLTGFAVRRLRRG